MTISKTNLKNVTRYIEGDEAALKSEEHKGKYLENKGIVDTILNERNKEHCNWVSTICFMLCCMLLKCSWLWIEYIVKIISTVKKTCRIIRATQI